MTHHENNYDQKDERYDAATYKVDLVFELPSGFQYKLCGEDGETAEQCKIEH